MCRRSPNLRGGVIMSRICRKPIACGAILTAALALASSNVQASINLEFRKAAQSVCPGQTVRVGLFAVSDNASVQTLAAIDLVFAWDPTYLQLQNIDQTGAVNLSASF